MKDLVDNGLLYDFYGELLTDHQRNIYESAVYDDMSLNEIAGEQGISRQGVHDLIKRCTATMEGYEDKLHMVKRYKEISDNVQKLKAVAADKSLGKDELIEEINRIADTIIEELS
ncbi:MAG: DNA-binding protein [Butyrivibrio sp.]|nr:DNA-binding protein [Butyrivibrio sp.]